MAGNSATKSILVTILIFAMILSPLSTCDAARLSYQERPICPACVCCRPPPPGSACCRCCAAPIETQPAENGSP
ncbi:hypothetical protein FEM48_Zijuj01G0275800 [Ziziphus jujuba var. spinosa]|uniref:Uncharacterized protein n=1 Tax=Ziziphus jujuba var. spinosa TaxID=714518 RepID=A0A978W589_ZIZJJ|nr:hypothetical protein FEM48_Zijuj01G0275800 [Ziziphus jujuba var. spinosa]